MTPFSKQTAWLLCGLLLSFSLGLTAGWLIGQAPTADLRNQVSSQKQQLGVAKQRVASDSAQLSSLKEKVTGYQDYVISHTQQSIDTRFLTGYRSPIAGMLPPYTHISAMPGAGRAYRGGIHEGMDFAVSQDTPALAVGAGQIIRSDTNYREPSAADLEALSLLTEQLQFTPENILDTFRGRQVWLLLPGHVIVRYCHLSAVSVTIGQTVTTGQVVGKTGSSGTLDGAKHLHFEIRVGNTYLGSDQSYPSMVELIKKFFSS